jgi:hypothetical protein
VNASNTWQALQGYLKAARAGLEAGDRARALQAVDAALDIDPNFLAAHALRERILSAPPDAAPAPDDHANDAGCPPLVETGGTSIFKRRRVDRQLDAAQAAIESGRLRDARAALDEVIELDPNSLELRDLAEKLDVLRGARAPSRRSRWLAAAAAFAGITIGAQYVWPRLLTSLPGVEAPRAPRPEPLAQGTAGAVTNVTPTPGPAASAVPAGAGGRDRRRIPALSETGSRRAAPVSTARPPDRLQRPAARVPGSLVAVASPHPGSRPAPTTSDAAGRLDKRSAPVNTPSAPIDARSAPVNAFSAPVDTRSAPVNAFSAPVDTPGAPAPPAAPAARPPAATAVTPGPALRTAETRDEEGLVKDVLLRYRRAYDGLDARSARAVWPKVDEPALARAFSGLRSQTLTFKECDLSVRNDRAAATCHGTARYVPKVGSDEPRVEPRVWSFTLRKNGPEWQIQSVRAER